MRVILLLAAIFEVVSYVNSYKMPLMSVPYPANRQGSLYDDDLNDILYKQTLENLARLAENYHDSDEYNNGDYVNYDSGLFENEKETQSHSSLGQGFQYIQGGSGEGKQHLHPDGSQLNQNHIQSDDELPTYCNPPNPCPIGYKIKGDECDQRPFDEFTAEYSKFYQQSQDCLCDDDHNDCSRAGLKKKSTDSDVQIIKEMQAKKSDSRFSAVVAKKSPRIRRDTQNMNKNQNPYLKGDPIKFHVAKKSAP